MIDRKAITMQPLFNFLTEYKEFNSDNLYNPVAVGRYGIRSRESIYSKELAKDYSKNKIIRKGTLTVGMGSVQMDIGILTDDVIYSVSPAYHTYDISKIDCDYLRYCLQCRNIDMFTRYMKRGSRQGKSIDLDRWITYEIPVYPTFMQLEIVERLNKVCHIVALHEQQLKALDDLVKARFVEMFGHVSTMNSSPVKLSEVLTVNPKKDDIDDDIYVTFLPMEKVGTNGNIDTTEIRKYKDVKKGFNHIKENDVLFAKITPCMENGKATIARGLCNGYGNSTTELFALRCNENVVPEYIFQIVHSEYFRKCAEENMTGTAGQRRVPKAFIEGFHITVPPIELQYEFAEFVQEVDKSKFVVQKALDEAQTLFDSLMQKYFG